MSVDVRLEDGTTVPISPAAGSPVTSVGAAAPITSTGGVTPTIGINPAVAGVSAGSLSAADKTKLDGITTVVASVGATAPITSTGGATPNIGITPATDIAAGSMSAADKTKLDGIGPGGFPLRVQTELGVGGINHVHVPAAVAGTVAVVTGSKNIVFSVAPGLHLGDLLFDGTGAPSTLPAVNELAADTVGVNGVLTAPWTGASNPALAMTTYPLTDAILTPGPIAPLSAAGWRLHVSGQLGIHNTVAGAQTVAYYIAGLAAFGVGGSAAEGVVFDVPAGANKHYLLPISTDLLAAGPGAPVTHDAHMFVWAFGGAPGDIETTTIPGNNQEVVTLVG